MLFVVFHSSRFTFCNSCYTFFSLLPLLQIRTFFVFHDRCFLKTRVAQLVKNLLAMRETGVQPLCWEDPLEKGTTTHSSILAWRIRGLYSPWGHKESDMTEQLSISEASYFAEYFST